MVVHRFRLADVFRAVDGLRLSARLERLAHAVSVLSQYHLFFGDDVLSVVFEFDDGLWRFGLEPRRQSRARKWIIATILLGLTFVVLHLFEWKHLIGEGLRPFFLPEHWVKVFTTTDGTPPSPLFGATFFAITGLHMFHVLTGALYLGVVAARVKKLKHEDVEISGLYWHFVDLVWMFVFPLIYIMSVDVHGVDQISLWRRSPG